MLRTSLYDWHSTNGARLVEFGGWEMPVQYSSIVEEHHAVRKNVGIFDVSHMGRFSFAGDEAENLLQHVCTNNATSMKENQIRYNLICNEQGGILDDVLVYRWPYGWSMVVNASNRQKILDWLHQQNEHHEVDVEDRTLDTCMIAVQGPKAIEICKGLTETDFSNLKYYYGAPTRYEEHACVVSRTGYTGEDGLEFMISKDYGIKLWEALVERGAVPCGLGARDTLRLEAAMPLYGHELNEETNPLEAGLDWAVKFNKGEFIGREAIEKTKDNLLRRRVGLELTGKRIAREGATILKDGNKIGTITSGTFSPTLKKSLSMGYVQPEFSEDGTELTIDIRGKQESARVVSLPFYQRQQ